GDQVLVASDVEDTTIQAIDRRTGGNLWTRTLNGQGQMIPVVADATLYIGGSEFGVVALDTANGDVRWALPLEGLTAGGMAVTGGLVIAAIGEGRWRARGRTLAAAVCLWL